MKLRLGPLLVFIGVTLAILLLASVFLPFPRPLIMYRPLLIWLFVCVGALIVYGIVLMALEERKKRERELLRQWKEARR